MFTSTCRLVVMVLATLPIVTHWQYASVSNNSVIKESARRTGCYSAFGSTWDILYDFNQFSTPFRDMPDENLHSSVGGMTRDKVRVSSAGHDRQLEDPERTMAIYHL